MFISVAEQPATVTKQEKPGNTAHFLNLHSFTRAVQAATLCYRASSVVLFHEWFHIHTCRDNLETVGVWQLFYHAIQI